MASALEDIRREVAEARAGQASAVQLIRGLRDKLDQMIDDSTSYKELSEAVAGLANDLSDSTDELAAAVAEEPAEEPAPTEGSEGPTDNGNVNPVDNVGGDSETP